MKNTIAIGILIILSWESLVGQHYYEGVIDTHAIKLMLYERSGNIKGFYLYEKYNSPISLSEKGKKIKGEYVRFPNTLYELTEQGGHYAELSFDSLNYKKQILRGDWKMLNSDKKLRIVLMKKELGSRPFTLPASISTDNQYFLVEYKENNAELLIYRKSTHELIQRIDSVNCSYRRLVMEVDDYNFDGIKDFSIHRSFAAGPNTFRVYYLWDPNKNEFFKSKIDGSSLYFDHKKDLIYEHNQCCAGSSHMRAVYKLVENEMIIVSQRCYRLGESGELVPDKCD